MTTFSGSAVRRKNFVVTVIICLCLAGNIAAIIQTVARIHFSYTSEIASFEAAIGILMSDASKMKADGRLDQQVLINRIGLFAKETKQVILLVFYDRKLGFKYVYPINSPLLLEKPDAGLPWEGAPSIAKDTLTEKIQNVKFNALGFPDLVLSMIVRAPDPSDLAVIFRDSLLIVLASFLLGIVGIVYPSRRTASTTASEYISLAQLTRQMGVYESMPTYIRPILKNSIAITIITNIISIPIMIFTPHVIKRIGHVSSSGFFLWFTADVLNFLLQCSHYLSYFLLVLNIFSLIMILVVLFTSWGMTKPVRTSVHGLARAAAIPSGLTIISGVIIAGLFIAIIIVALLIWILIILFVFGLLSAMIKGSSK